MTDNYGGGSTALGAPQGKLAPERWRRLQHCACAALRAHLALGQRYSPLNRETLYGGTEQGYTDYPVLRTVAPHECQADAERSWG